MTSPSSAPRVLVVENERLIALVLDKRLRALGYTVVGAATSGHEAVRLAVALRPDLVLMDIELGDGMDGVEAAAVIRQQVDVPVVFLTAHSDAATLERAKVTGPHGYVLKPHHDRDIQIAVEIGLYRHRTERQLDDYRRKLEEANARLEWLSTTDGLTGLRNRRAFDERLAENVRRAERYPVELSLVLLDVDRFKTFNDTFGHPAGDEVLRAVDRLLAATTRETDVAARYGGEEFAVLLPDTDEAAAGVVAERLRRAVEAAEWQLRPVTVSVGVATLSSLGNWIGLVAAADAALYQSKADGRNRVTRAGRPEAALAAIG